MSRQERRDAGLRRSQLGGQIEFGQVFGSPEYDAYIYDDGRSPVYLPREVKYPFLDAVSRVGQSLNTPISNDPGYVPTIAGHVPGEPVTLDMLASGVDSIRQTLRSGDPIDPQNSVGDFVADVAGSAARGVRRGVVANIAGAPVEIVNALPLAGNILPGEQGWGPISDNPVGGAQFFDELLRGGVSDVVEPVVPDYQPQTTAGRVANRIGEELGATAVPVAGSAVAASRLGVDGARRLNPIARQFVEPMAIDPGRVLAREFGYGAAAGAGAQAANEMVDPEGEGTWWSDLLGSIGGVTTAGTLNTLGGAGARMWGAARGNTAMYDDVAGQVVASRIIDNSTDMQNAYAKYGREGVDPSMLAARLETPSRAEQAFPGYIADTADRAQDPGLAVLAYNTNTVLPGAAAARRNANAQVVDDWFVGNAPEGNASELRAALQQGAQSRIDAANANVEGVRGATEGLIQQAMPQMGAVDRGYAIREGLAGAFDSAKTANRTARNEILSKGGQAPASELQAMFLQAQDGLAVNDLARVPPDVQRAMGLDPERLIGAEDAQSYQRGIKAAARNASDDAHARYVAGKMMDPADEFMKSLLPEDQRALLDSVNADRLDIGRRFEDRGAVPDILRKTGRDQYRMADEVVPGRVLRGETDYKAVMAEAGRDPAARRAVADQVLADAQRSNALRSPEALARFTQERNFVLSDFPEVKAGLERAGASKRMLEQAEAAAAQTTRDLSPGGPSATGQYLRYDDTGTRQAIKTAWNSDQPERSIRELLDVAGDTPQTRSAAKAALWEEVKETGRLSARTETGDDGVTRWSGRKLQERLNDPKFARTAEILWEDDPQHLANIRGAAEALAGAEGSLRARAPGSSGTAQALSGKFDPALSTASIASRVRSVNRGQLSPTIAIVDVASTALRNRAGRVQAKAIDEMLARAINDPDFAAALLRKHNPADEAAMKRAFLGAYGVRMPTLANILAGDDADEDETLERMGDTE